MDGAVFRGGNDVRPLVTEQVVPIRRADKVEAGRLKPRHRGNNGPKSAFADSRPRLDCICTISSLPRTELRTGLEKQSTGQSAKADFVPL
jgi:hypothetical protein